MGPERRRVPLAEPPDKRLRMRMAALAGAAYHSHGAPYANAPYFLRPLSLDRVIQHLADEEPHIRSHGAAWLLDGASHPARKKRLHDAAQKVLGSHAAVGDVVRESKMDDEPPAMRGWSVSPGHLRSRAAKGLDFLASVASTACVRKDFQLSIEQDPATLITVVQAQVDVNRPPEEFRVASD